MIENNDKLSRICEGYITLLSVITGFLMLLIVGSTFLQVFCRKVLNNPLTWTEELSRFAFIWMNCMGSAIVIREKKHISFSIIADTYLGEKGQKILAVGINLLLIMFSLLVLAPTISLVQRTNSIPSAAMQIPSGMFYLSFAVGSLMMLGAYVIDILDIFGIVAPREVAHVN